MCTEQPRNQTHVFNFQAKTMSLFANSLLLSLRISFGLTQPLRNRTACKLRIAPLINVGSGHISSNVRVLTNTHTTPTSRTEQLEHETSCLIASDLTDLRQTLKLS